MIEILKCYFCKKDCKGHIYYPNRPEDKTWECYHPYEKVIGNKRGTTVYHLPLLQQDQYGVYFSAEYKDSLYTIYFYPDTSWCKIHLSKPKNLLKSPENPILTFEYLPNITPENFPDKLPTLLTFS